MDSLSPIWPRTRTSVAGTPLGDAWPYSLASGPPTWESIIPFHKLTQWLAYSLMTPMSRLMHVQFAGVDLLTGLPEYRNGGLLVDTGLLTLKPEDVRRGLANYADVMKAQGAGAGMEVVPMFEVADEVIVEWRALTVGFLDALLGKVNALLGLGAGEGLTLAQMLEAGTWKVCGFFLHFSVVRVFGDLAPFI